MIYTLFLKLINNLSQYFMYLPIYIYLIDASCVCQTPMSKWNDISILVQQSHVNYSLESNDGTLSHLRVST